MNHTAPTAAAPAPRCCSAAKTPPAKIGFFATLRAFLPGANGSGAPSRALLATSLIALAALLAPAIAQASPPGLVPFSQFPSKGVLGVAVDNSGGPSQGDVYTAGFFTATPEGELVPGRVNKFDASGSLLTPPPFGEAFLYSGAAVNPVNGDVYALGQAALFGAPSVFTYDPATGEPLGSPFPVPASNNFTFFGLPIITTVQIASDSAGDVYVPVVPEYEVLEYESSGGTPPGTPLKTFTGGSGAGALNEPTAVALDPSGNLWVADSGNQRIEELSPAGAPLADISVEGTLESVAVDGHGHLFATVRNGADPCGSLPPPCSHLLEYTTAGAQLADLGAGEYGGGGEESNIEPPTMVAVNESTGRVYVTDYVSNRVFIYAPPTPPQVENELAVGVTTSEAKLGALVNPGGIATSYRFEYGTTTAYGQSAPSPEGDAGTGFRSRTVWASPSDLQPGTTYHYRVIVANELGEAQGVDKTFTTETAAQAACPNNRFRSGFSATLPDCRAYELVTPPNKLGAQADKEKCNNQPGDCPIEKTLAHNFAGADGNRLQFVAEDVLPGSPGGGEEYLATRGSAGWSLENQIPPTNSYARGCQVFTEATAHSEDLSKAILSGVSGGTCGIEPELVSGEPRGTVNLYLRDNATGAYQLINLTPPGATPADAHLTATSRDLSHVVFTEQAQLTPEALPGVDNLYEWSAGQLRLLTLLSGTETPVAGSYQAISADGSHVFFTAEGNLYARVNGTETVQLDASEAAGPGGGGEFRVASHDGSQVYFTDDASAALTADTVPASGTNLYRYDSAVPAGQRLTDLTPVANAGTPFLDPNNGISHDGSQVYFTDDASAALTADTEPGSGTNLYRYASGQLTDLTPAIHAEVERVAGVSEDGSPVYFVAKGVLTAEPNQHGETAQSGQPNLYLFQAGATIFIVQAGGARISANGSFLALESSRSLTGYDNNAASGHCGLGVFGSPEPPACPELYLYDAAANSLACASCNPSGEPPTGLGVSESHSGASFEFRPARNLTENGRLFFDTADALLPSDTNATGGCPGSHAGNPSCLDVYEFEPGGVGTCADPAGCLFLISTGTGNLETAFIDASASGDDVFIREFQGLVPSHTAEEQSTIYDVRVGGGLPEPASPLACTTAESCHPHPATAPAEPTLSTSVPSGPGNFSSQRKHRHKKHKAKKHHKAKKSQSKRSANDNRRAGK